MSQPTPMMKQYLRIKAEHKDSFLLFRLGDFYELFYEDAIKAAQILEITLTKRDSSQADPIPMCGVPHHSADRYIKTLVDQGYKVAICEQVEDPKTAKGVVKREVVQLITPGTVMDEAMLKENESNYIASLSHFKSDLFVIVYHELSTGETQLISITDGFQTVIHELINRQIKELVISTRLNKELVNSIKEKLNVTLSYEHDDDIKDEFSHLVDDIEDLYLIKGFSQLLNYIKHTQKRSLTHLQKPKIIELKQYLSLDMYSKRNLELTETLMKKEKYGSLLWVLDETVTAMGARLLKRWIERPLLSKQQIDWRLNMVETFYNAFFERNNLREALKTVYDLERLAGRISFGNVNARDLIQLKQSLKNIPDIKQVLSTLNSEQANEINNKLTYPEHIINLLESSIIDEPPISITEGSIIKDGYNEKLDQYRDVAKNGKNWIAQLEQQERELTGIKSLKIGYNRVFGYYIEITHANKELIPEGRYERKQTLRNAERYITPELKEKEQLILEADEKSVDLEYDLFVEIRELMKDHIEHIQTLATILSEIDVLQSFAEVSEKNRYVKPQFVDDALYVVNGRHPVIETVMDGTFVPNDITLNDEHSILLITGPNMSGKSTYMRQLALTIIMAQIGCFVPADDAQLILFDQIFTRIGASDDLVAGQSTFMVEMLEANYALSNATENSLILLDEIGRGTSTYDGMALAQAIIEYIHEDVKAKTLFSTHYHELTILEEKLVQVKNIHVKAEEYDESIVFLHKIEDGKADESYGIHVAKLAQLPNTLIERASSILEELETTDKTEQQIKRKSEHDDVKTAESEGQLSFFVQEKEPQANLSDEEKQILKRIKQLNLLNMTPLDAINELHAIQTMFNKK